MKKRLVSLLLIAFLVLTDIAPVITVAAEELGAVDGEPVIEQMDEPIESLPEGGDSDGLTEEPVPIGWGSASQEVMMASVGNTITTPITTWDFEEDTSGAGWVWDHETSTLTITDLTIDLSEYAFDDAWCAIGLDEGTLVSAGSGNKIIAPAACWDAIDFYGACTITGDAPLTIETEGDFGIASDGSFSLTIDGTPISITAAEAAIRYADSVITFNGGSHIATAGVKIGVYGNYYATVKDGELAPNVEIAVADEYIEQTAIPEALYAGKSNDSAMSVTLTVGAVVVGSEDPLTYQWYSCDDYNGANPVAISGATSASYTFSGSLEAEEYYFFCRATAGTLTRDFPVSKVVLTASGVLTYTEEMSLTTATASVDNLATYGWKWDKDTATLTLDGAYIDNGKYGIQIGKDFANAGKTVTIVLAEGRTNTVCGGDGAYALTFDSHTEITGPGTLELQGKGDRTLYALGGGWLTISGGAQVSVNQTQKNNITYPVYFWRGSALRLEDEGTTLTVSAVDNSRILTISSFANYTEAQMQEYFLMSGPTSPKMDYLGVLLSSNQTYMGELVLTANLEKRLSFTKYPDTQYKVEKNESVTMTAGAKMVNHGGEAPTVAYQWYLGDKAIDGATNASYTFTPTEKGVFYLRCDVTAEAGGKEYTLTGRDIFVLCEAHEKVLSLSTATASVDELKTYGYKWDKDTKTLTLDGFIQHSAGTNNCIYVSTSATIVLAEGSTNVLTSSTCDAIYVATDCTLTITGGGTLQVNTFAAPGQNKKAFDLKRSSDIVVKNGAQVEAVTRGSVAVNGTNGNNAIILKGKDTTFSATAAEGGKAISLYEPVIGEWDFVVKTPDGGKFSVIDGTTISTDSAGNAVEHCVLGANTTVRLNFTKYPEAKYTLDRNASETLTVAAELVNAENAPAIAYQWYLDGEAIPGATKASYTFADAASGVYTLRCDVSVTVEGTPYSLTGEDITVRYGAHGEEIALRDDTDSVDKMDTRGWKWDADTKTLTLDGAYIDPGVGEALYVDTDATIVLTEGSVNTVTTEGYPLFLESSADVTITGEGTLRCVADNMHSAIHMNNGVTLTVKGGAKVEALTPGPECVTSAAGLSIRLRGAGSSFSATAGESGYAFDLYNPVIDSSDFLLQEPAGGKIEYGRVKDSEGNNVNHCVLVPARWYVTDSPEETVPTSVGQTVKLTVNTEITDNNTSLTYQWYTTEDYYNPVGDSTTKAIPGATAAAYSIKVTERGMQGYYFCEVSDGVTTVVTPVSAVVAGAKGKLPITEPIDTEATVDKLTTHGYKWDAETNILTLNNAEVYLPYYDYYSVWFEVPAADTVIRLGDGSVNNVTKDCIGFADGYDLTVAGAGSLNMGEHLYSEGALTVTEGAAVSMAYIELEGETAALTVEKGASLQTTEDTNDVINGDITVDGGTLTLRWLQNYYTGKHITVENGGKLVHHRNLYHYGTGITVGADSEMTVEKGTLYLGKADDPAATKLTVAGTLIIDPYYPQYPFFIYTTLDAKDAFVVNGEAAVRIPEEYKCIKDGVSVTLGNMDESTYLGALLVADEDYQPIPLQSISMVGTPKYGQRLDFVTVPADAMIDAYVVEYAYSPNGPWRQLSYGDSRWMELSTRYVDYYLRVRATAKLTHSGEVTSQVVGPVEGDPTTLKALYIDGVTFEQKDFDGDTFEYELTLGADRAGVFTRSCRAVPVSNGAKVTMKVVNTAYPDGLTFDGVAADIPFIMGQNTVTVTVTYGESVKTYTFTVAVTMKTGKFELRNYTTNDTVITAKLDYSNGETVDETYTLNTVNSSTVVWDVPYDTVITLTAVTPEGKRLWCYGEAGLTADDDGENTLNMTFGEFCSHVAGVAVVRDSHVIAVTPELGAVRWDSFVDRNGMSNALMDVQPLVNSGAGVDEYGYYNIRIEAMDADSGVVAATYNTADNEDEPEDGFITCEMKLDPTKDHTFRVCYDELLSDAHDIAAEAEAAQYASAELAAMPENVELIPSTDHIILVGEETTEITFTAEGFDCSDVVLLESTNGEVAEYDDGVITALSEGTTWMTFGLMVQMVEGVGPRYAYATVRVDVVDGAVDRPNLGITSGALNLFDDSVLTVPVYNLGQEIVKAEFVDETMNEIFAIEVVGVRTLRVVPKEKDSGQTWAEWGKALSGTYTSAINIYYTEEDFRISAETLTVKLSAKAPSVKATAVKVNSFFQNASTELEFTTKDGVVERVQATACPEWLTLNDMTVTLDNSKLDAKGKGSGKLNVEVWLEGFRAPAQVTVSVSAAYTAPKVKLSTTTVSPVADSEYQASIPMQLLSSDKKVSFAELGITDIRVATEADLAGMTEKDRAAYADASRAIESSNFDGETGAFQLHTTADPVNGKTALIVTFGGNGKQTVVLPVTVKVVPLPTLKASTTKVTLNPIYGAGVDQKVVTLSASAQGFKFTDDKVHCTVIGPDGNTSDLLSVVVRYGAELTIATAHDDTPDGTYKVSVTADGAAEKAVVIAVTVKTTAPKMKLSASSVTLNRVKGNDYQTVTITGTDPAYQVELTDGSFQVLDAKGKDVTDEGYLNWTWYPWKNGLETRLPSTAVPGTYKVVITDDALDEVTAALTVKVVDQYPSVKANPTSITLLKGTAFSEQTVTFTGLDGYTLYSTNATVNGNALASCGIDYELGDDTMTFSLDGAAPGSYKVAVTPTFAYYGGPLSGKPINITVKVVESVSGTASVKSTLDVTRPETGTAPFTFKWNGWSPAEYEGANSPVLEWEVYAMNGSVAVEDGEPVASGACCSSGNESTGWFWNVSTDPYGVTLALNESGLVNINPKYTYNVVFTLRFPDAPALDFEFKPVKMTVKQGSTKFAADVKDVTLSKWDGYDRAFFDLCSTDKDADNVADIATVAVSSDLFEVTKVGNKYAICWKDNTVPATAKSGSVKLSIWLEGNSFENKPNATVSVKVNVK